MAKVTRDLSVSKNMYRYTALLEGIRNMNKIRIYSRNRSNDYWSDFPDELSKLYHTVFVKCDDEACRYLIRKLKFYLNKNEKTVTAIKWIDRFFSDIIMLSGEFLHDIWHDSVDELLYLLDKEKYLLSLVSDMNITYKTTDSDQCSVYAQTIQDLYMYYATVGLCSGMMELFEQSMEGVLKYTQYNLEYLISNENIVPNFYPLADDDIYYRGNDYFEEPFAWIMHFAIQNGYSYRVITMQEKYVQILEKIYKQDANNNISFYLQKAYFRTTTICTSAIDRLMEISIFNREDNNLKAAIEAESKIISITAILDRYTSKLSKFVIN